MEDTKPALSEAPGPEPDTQLQSKPKRKYFLDRSKALALQTPAKSQQIVEFDENPESSALKDLHVAKAALLTLQATHKQAKANLLAQQADEVSQAEQQILALRIRYLDIQRAGGQERRAMKEFKEESRFTEKTGIAAARQRLSDVKEALEKLSVLASDWTAAGLKSDPVEKKLEAFDSRYIDLYEDGKLDDETPDEFIARQKEWLDKMLTAARETLAAAKAGPHVAERLKHLPPLFQPKEGATINWKARKKRLLFLSLAKAGEPGARL